jgi:hypothetical protein
VDTSVKRSQHTHYRYHRATVYEFKNQYFVMEECQQGRVLLPAHGPGQIASDYAGLSATLPVHYLDAEMGAAVVRALDDFDSRAHPFDQFDFSARNKQIAQWMGARGIQSLETNSRKVHVELQLQDRALQVFAYANCTADPWYGPMLDRPIGLSAAASLDDIGAAVRSAFERATYHPDRKDRPTFA